MSSGLTFEGVSHAYGDTKVLRDVYLSVKEGEILCLLGPSGCGKSTTLRTAAGLEPITAGTVSIGEEILTQPGRTAAPETRRVGYVPQDYALFPHLTVAQNVGFGLDRNDPHRVERITELLNSVELPNYSDAYPHMLSGGQQQRVALARALAPNPAVMLMDEPFSGLDATLRGDVRARTVEILRRAGVPTLIVTHDGFEAWEVADTIAVMKEGKIVQTGTPEDLMQRPVNEFVASFFTPPAALRNDKPHREQEAP